MPESWAFKPADASSPSELARAVTWAEAWRAELVLAFVVLWVAYGFLGFNLSTAGDDWVALTDDSVLVRYALENGRWLHAALMVMQDHSRVAPTFSIAVLLLAIVGAMAMFAGALGLKRRGTVLLLVVLAGCFPFWAEFASFRILHLPGALALLLSCGFGYMVWRAVCEWGHSTLLGRVWRLTLAGTLFSLCAATYQGFLPVGVMLLGCYVLGELCAHETQRVHPARREYQGRAVRVCTLTIIAFGVGVLLYSGQVALSRIVTGVGASIEPTYQLASSLVSDANDLRLTVARLGDYLWAFYAQPNHLFPLWPKLLFTLVLLVFVLRVLFSQDYAPRGKRLWALGVLGVLVLAPWALGVIRMPDPYRYNAIVSAGVIYAVVLSYTLDRMRGMLGSVLVAGAGTAIALCFVFEQNSAAHITHQNNLRDMAVVNRLLNRFAMAPGYQRLSRHAPVNVVLSGEFQIPAGRPFHAAPVSSVLGSSIVDCDILRCQPARLDWATPLASADAVRYRFVRLADQSPAYQAVLRPVIEQLSHWPANRSVYVVDDTTVVVRLPVSVSGANRLKWDRQNSQATVGLLPVTASGDGFVVTQNGVGAFSVGLSNFGPAVTYRLTVQPTVARSGLGVQICQTEPQTGLCLADPVVADIGLDIALDERQNATFAVFVNASAPIDGDVLGNRLVVRLADGDGNVRAATSVAVASKAPVSDL